MDDREIAGIQVAPVEEQIKSLLEGIGENDTVTIHNPLSLDFRGQFARSVTQQSPLSEQDKRMAELGVPVTKDQGAAQAHSVQYVIIPAGKTLKLFGYAAKVVVRQLVTEIIQRQNGRNKIADDFTRRQVEERVIVGTQVFQNAIVDTPDEQFAKEIDQLNNPYSNLEVEKKVDERSFPSESVSNDTEEPAEVHPKTAGLSGEDRTGHTDSAKRTGVSQKPTRNSKAKA